MSTADQKGWIRFLGKSPSGVGEQEFKLPSKTVLHFRSNGHERKFCEIFSIELVLKNPTVIFEGLERDEFGDGLCYCGIPPFRQISDDARGPTPAGMVFVVFINKEFAIFEFRREKMHETKPSHPRDCVTRFTRIKWPR